jgi:PAS domain S-box-containing protein
MNKKPAPPPDAAELYRQAEAKLSERKKKTTASSATEFDSKCLVHELEVHQIELEMQNEELAQSNAQVKEVLHKYTDLYDSAPIGYFTLARDGAIHQVNLVGANLLGVERDALMKRRFGVFVSAQSRTTFSVFLDDVFTSGSKETCEVTLLKDGAAPRFVQIEAVTKDGQCEMCHAVVMDITERKKAEEALKISETRYRRLFESAKDGIMILDAETGIIVDVNPFLIEMMGYSHKSVKGKVIWELEFFKDVAANKEKFVELQQRDYVLYENLSLETSDRRQIAVEFISNVYLVDRKKVIQCNIRDTTERKQMEHKLNEAYQKIKTRTNELEMINEHLDSFAYSVSHDLRAPLRAISGFAQVLLDTQGDKVNEEMRHYLNRISEGAKKMGQLIDDLLGFSRATRGEIKYEKINVENIVNNLVKAYRDVELDRDIEFIVNPLGEVEADKEMLKVIFSNLLQNAVKFTIDRKKTRIEIGSEQKEDHIQFYIKDNGIGFDMRYKDKLFTAFQRLHTDERFTGTGIGLTTVKRIVTKHGGNIWANGEVDKGAEFYFTLPSKTHVKD